MATHMLTTIDNPCNPFTEYEKWEKFDRDNKHFCNEVLARNTFVSEIFSEQQQEEEREIGIENVVTNPLYAGIYIRVTEDSKIVPIPIDWI